MKTNDLKNNEQNSLQAKELQKFFNKIKAVLFTPKDSKMQSMNYPLLCLVLDQETFKDFKDYGINKIIIDLLDNKYPILSIKAEENNKLIGLSITDKASGLTFRLPEQEMSEPLVKFLEGSKYDDKIPIMLGYFNDDTIVFDKNIKGNLLLVLDGYVFE